MKPVRDMMLSANVSVVDS